MHKKKNFLSSPRTRRNFLKTKIFGGLFLLSGIPFIPFGNLNRQSALPPSAKNRNNKNGILDWEEIREQFTIKLGNYFYNTASLGPSPKSVVNKICETLKMLETVPKDGHRLMPAVREKIAKFFNAEPDEIAITRNATEGMNIVARSLRLKKGDEVLLTTHEHIGGAAPWLALQKDLGIDIKLIELDLNGEKNLQLIKDSITDKTKAISFSHITCTTGMVLPAEEIVQLCRNNGIYSCVDGAQAVGMIPVDLKVINPDFYIGSGHKWLLGPKGTGILFVNKDVIGKINPVYVGAYTDSKFNLPELELEYRTVAAREEYGTRNTPIAVGLGEAVDFLSSIGIERVADRGMELAEKFRKSITTIPRVEIVSPSNQKYSCSIVCFRVKELDYKYLEEKIRVNDSIRTRRIYENNLNAIRVSFSIHNSMEDVDYLVAALKRVIVE